jgi:hypothetical protein
MYSISRHKSTRHQPHVCMSQQVQTCLCFWTAYSLALWLNFHILNLQYAKCPTQTAYHWCFRDDRVTSSYILLQRVRDKVRLRLPEWRPQTKVKIGTSSGHVVLNDLQWFILVTFKSNISKNEVHELCESRHTLSMYCGQYIRIKSENTQVYLNKKIGHNWWI